MGSARLRSLWDLMESFEYADLLVAVNALGNFAHFLQPGMQLPESNVNELIQRAETVERICRQHGFAASWDTAKRVVEAAKTAIPTGAILLGEPALTWREFDMLKLSDRSKELAGRLQAELSAALVFEIPLSKRQYLETQEPPFGEAVDRAFPGTRDDLEEAGKCLAFGLPTACVFHLMRAAEGAAAVVVKSFGGETHKDDGEPITFGGFFNQVRDRVLAMPRGREKDAWNKLSGFMSSLNRGDRTKVAHPGQFYSEPQAERLFALTRSFMEEAEELLRA